MVKGSNSEFLEAGAGNLTRVSGTLPAETFGCPNEPGASATTWQVKNNFGDGYSNPGDNSYIDGE